MTDKNQKTLNEYNEALNAKLRQQKARSQAAAKNEADKDYEDLLKKVTNQLKEYKEDSHNHTEHSVIIMMKDWTHKRPPLLSVHSEVEKIPFMIAEAFAHLPEEVLIHTLVLICAHDPNNFELLNAICEMANKDKDEDEDAESDKAEDAESDKDEDAESDKG